MSLLFRSDFLFRARTEKNLADGLALAIMNYRALAHVSSFGIAGVTIIIDSIHLCCVKFRFSWF